MKNKITNTSLIIIIIIAHIALSSSAEENEEQVIFGEVSSRIIENTDRDKSSKTAYSIQFECVDGIHIDSVCISERILPNKIKKYKESLNDKIKIIKSLSTEKDHKNILEIKSLTIKYRSIINENIDNFNLKKLNNKIKQYKKILGIKKRYNIFLDTDGIDVVPYDGLNASDGFIYKLIEDGYPKNFAITAINFAENIILVDYFNQFYFNKIYKKAKVYSSESIKRPNIDPIGNIYLPKDLYDTCKKKCIDVILLHEALHLLTRNSYTAVILKTLNDIDNIDEISNKKLIKNILGMSGKIDETFIDIEVMKIIKGDKELRNEYLSILSKYLIHQESSNKNKYRLKLVEILNEYINYKNSYEIFDVLYGRNILYALDNRMKLESVNNTDRIDIYNSSFNQLLKELKVNNQQEIIINEYVTTQSPEKSAMLPV